MSRAGATARRPAVGALLSVVALAFGGGAEASQLLTDLAGGQVEQAGSVQTITLADDWRVTCDRTDAAESCRMSTVGVGETAGGRQIAVQLASESAEGSGRLFFFLTPLDLLVAKGAEMRIDNGRPQKLAYRSCHAQGCVVPFRLSAALERGFRRGTSLHLRLFAIDGSAIDVDLSLLGFSAASGAMEAR